MTDLEAAFQKAFIKMLNNRVNEIGYRASRVWDKFDEYNSNAVLTALWVLGIEGFASEGLRILWEAGRLDLSVQALILESNSQFYDLFTDEVRRQAQWTLDELRKNPPPRL